MPKQYDWQAAIRFMSNRMKTSTSELDSLVWRRMENGDRTQDLLQTVSALEDNEATQRSSSPEWEQSIHWLNLKRSQDNSLKYFLLWAQVETGDRTEELLALIQEEQAKEAETETISKKKK